IGKEELALAGFRSSRAQVQVEKLVAAPILGRGAVGAINDVDKRMGIEIETQRARGRGGDIRKVGGLTPNDDALKLVGKGGSVSRRRISLGIELEAGDLRSERNGAGNFVIIDVHRTGVDVEHGDQSFFAKIISLASTGLREGEKPRHIKFR